VLLGPGKQHVICIRLFYPMTNNLPSVPEKAKALWRIVKSAGPLLFAQSAKLSEAYAQHNLRLAEVEAIKELMIGEAKIITEVRKKLIDKYLDASPEDRLRLRQDIDMAERDLRQLGIYHKAIEHLPESQNATGSATTEENLNPSPEYKAWQDVFNDYARKQNEHWRVELLARALALESQAPGSVGQRALWFIGTVDDTEFHAFAALLNISIKFFGSYIIPNYQNFVQRQIPNYFKAAGSEVGQAFFVVSNLGLYGDLLQSSKRLKNEMPLIAKYGSRQVVGRFKNDVAIGGALPTILGDTISKLYDPQINELGTEIFNNWIDSLKPNIEIISDTETVTN
jgi:hypothetical protein